MPNTKPSPKVSIIMPTYNRAAYIVETIESIRNQTYQNWELIIVDDGSDDNTEEIIAQLKEERIRFYKAGLEGLIAKSGLQENITLTGELPHHELLQLMQQTKVFLHPSSYEGFGVVCLEALYSGAVVISFVKPMQMDIKNWHIVNTKEEMTQKTLEILQYPYAVYERVTVFTIDDTAKKMMELFGD